MLHPYVRCCSMHRLRLLSITVRMVAIEQPLACKQAVRYATALWHVYWKCFRRVAAAVEGGLVKGISAGNGYRDIPLPRLMVRTCSWASCMVCSTVRCTVCAISRTICCTLGSRATCCAWCSSGASEGDWPMAWR